MSTSNKADTAEIWRVHPFYTDFEVSNLGRLRMLNGNLRRKAGEIVKISSKTQQYPCISINNHSVYVSTIVAEAFGLREVGSTNSIYQIDRDFRNCRLDNLINLGDYYGTRIRNLVIEDRKPYRKCICCGGLIPLSRSNRKIDGRFHCDDCYNVKKNYHKQLVGSEVKRVNGKYLRICSHCKTAKSPTSFFTYEEQHERQLSVNTNNRFRRMCKDCCTGTGKFQTGRGRGELKGRAAVKSSNIFPTDRHGRIENFEELMVEYLEKGRYPYQSTGKLASLHFIRDVTRLVFDRPAKFMLMPNLGKEIAVYLETKGVFARGGHHFVERDPAIFSTTRYLARNLKGGSYVHNADINNLIAERPAAFGCVDVVHLDFNGILTSSGRESVRVMLDARKLVFVTIRDPKRWGLDNPNQCAMEFENAEVVGEFRYDGLGTAKMITYCVVSLEGVRRNYRGALAAEKLPDDHFGLEGDAVVTASRIVAIGKSYNAYRKRMRKKIEPICRTGTTVRDATKAGWKKFAEAMVKELAALKEPTPITKLSRKILSRQPLLNNIQNKLSPAMWPIVMLEEVASVVHANKLVILNRSDRARLELFTIRAASSSIHEMDATCAAFIREAVVPSDDESDWQRIGTVYNAYRRYCAAHGLVTAPQRSLTEYLRQNGNEPVRRYRDGVRRELFRFRIVEVSSSDVVESNRYQEEINRLLLAASSLPVSYRQQLTSMLMAA